MVTITNMKAVKSFESSTCGIVEPLIDRFGGSPDIVIASLALKISGGL